MSDVRLAADSGDINAVIVDVGGFLGIGEKPVAISFDSLNFKTDRSGAFYVYTGFTQEQLESAETYEVTSFDQKRDSMLVTR